MATKHSPVTSIPSKLSTKKPKYQCKYQKACEEEFSGIKKSTKGDSFVLCTYCNEHFSIAHGGKNDVKRRVERRKHVDNVHSANRVEFNVGYLVTV